MTHALSALCGIDFIDLEAHKNGVIWAFWLANIAINAVIGNH